jgi:Amt family ammonium transporter
MGSLAVGTAAAVICFFAVTKLKSWLGYDDSLDVFGVHCIGGITGALLTGVFCAPFLGGTGIYDYVANATGKDYSIATQVTSQLWAVCTTLVWSGVVAAIAYKIVDWTVGLRVPEDTEREGLDTVEHGERAYSE